MSNLAIKRIGVDMKNFQKGELDKVGIYCKFNEQDIFKAKILIVGPKDTPYEGGYYFFDLKYPEDYPINPPKVLFRTSGNYIRFNPNLYVDGKVCLSILGTWEGPGWSACHTLNTVLLSIQSLLNENPIHNEPGWENINDSRCHDYNKVLSYSNIKIAVLNMLENPPLGFDVFKDIMLEHLEKNKNYFLEFLEKNSKIPTILKCSIYSLNIKTNISQLKDRFKFYNIKNEIKKKPIRNAPNKKSSDYDVGYEMISENDGNMYVVSLTKTNKKRWKKKI